MEDENEKDFEKRKAVIQATRDLINANSLQYLGVSPDSLFIIDHVCESLSSLQIIKKRRSNLIDTRDIVCIVFQKIRLDDSFLRIGQMYAIDRSYVGKLFSKFCPIIAKILAPLIFCPSPEQTRKLLPIQFRLRYSKVEFIIDGLEIEIEKPSNPILQALTWSDYKQANTFKYLISITPCGLINFISIGYGGRISDKELTCTCGFLDKVRSGCYVMADRGFKHIDDVLREGGAFLIRPPSVGADQILSKELSMEAKRVASCRVHVERSIRRLREFLFCAPHACVDSHLIPLLDKAVTIACALINMQQPIIDQFGLKK